MDIEIRAIAQDEFEAWMHAIETAFGGHVRPEDLEAERSVLDPARCLAAIDDGEIVGCASSVIFTMTLPGGVAVPTVGVTGVGVKPTHRRRGVNTGLMRRQLDDAHKSGETVAALFASEGGIYGRFGYGLASLGAAIDLETARSAFVPAAGTGGRVRMFDRDAARDQVLSVWDRTRLKRPGTMAMDTTWFDYQFADKQHGEERRLFFAVHDSGEGPDGFAVYHVKSNWEDSIPKNVLELYALDALGPDAYASMWRFVLDVDLVQRLTAWGRPSDEALFHLLREPRRLNLRLKDALWVRLVDLPAALAARRYEVDGRVVLEVRDSFCSWNEGRYELEAGPDGASCRPTTDEADLVLTVNELAAAYLGGSTLLQLHRAGRVHEERAGALALADSMFRWDPAPWCPLFF